MDFVGVVCGADSDCKQGKVFEMKATGQETSGGHLEKGLIRQGSGCGTRDFWQVLTTATRREVPRGDQGSSGTSLPDS